MTVCPKCRYQRQQTDQSVHEGICPNCGIVYQKWLDRQLSLEEANTKPYVSFTDQPLLADRIELENAYPSRFQQLRSLFSYVPEKIPVEAFWTRAIALFLFALWGGYFITAGTSWEKIGSSFLHNVNLPFHEFGHILFMPLGNFMMILGGSLFQILLPLILMFVFLIKQRDTFAGCIMLWWCGQNFIDVSPYIADAQYRVLPLVGGGGEESHDWGNLLTMLNALDKTQSVANASAFIGTLLIITALCWGIFILKAQKQHLVSFRE